MGKGDIKLSFRVNIIILMVGLLLLCGGLVTTVGYTGSKKSIEVIAEKLIEQHKDGIVNNVLQYIQRAQSTLNVYRDMEAAGVFENLSIVDLKEYFTKALKNNPEFSNFYYADERGTFLMAKRMQDNSLSFRFSYHAGEEVITSWFHEEMKWTSQFPKELVEPADKAYDARARPWYEDAVMKGAVAWSDLYIFSSDGQPGITCSLPTFNSKGRVTGVLGIDINVATLSRFMDENSVLGSHAILLGKKGCVVGKTGAADENVYSVPEVRDGRQTIRPLNLADLQGTVFEDAYGAFNEYAPGEAPPSLHFSSYGEDYLATITPLSGDIPWDWTVSVIVSEDAFLGSAFNTALSTLAISAGLMLIAVVIALFFSNRIALPIVRLSTDMSRIKDFDLQDQAPMRSMVREVDDMIQSYSQMVGGLRSFQKYVPSDIVKRLITLGQEATIGGQARELTVFFSDIQSFTRTSESMHPQELVGHLSEYLSDMSDVIIGNKGTVDKYIGDAIMAFWGAPERLEDHPLHACKAALECRRQLRQRAVRAAKEGFPAFPTRIGMHTGTVTVGNIGSDERMNYTVIGDGVNLASRLEGLNKYYGTEIIISEATQKAVAGHMETRLLDSVVVKGKSQPIRIYELLALRGGLSPTREELMTLFGEGLDLYLKRDFATAMQRFAMAYKLDNQDKPTILYHNRCRHYMKTPPPENWNGVFIMKRK